MNAADLRHAGRGPELLLEHCQAISRDGSRAPAHERLQQLIGDSMTRLLLVALTGDHGMRSRALPV
jgi:hypothetical protein